MTAFGFMFDTINIRTDIAIRDIVSAVLNSAIKYRIVMKSEFL